MTDASLSVPAAVRSTTLGSLRCEPLTPTIGAEISGALLGDIAADEALFVEVYAHWLQHKVLFFRDQNASRADFAAFACRFGALEGHAVADSRPDFPGIIHILRSDGPPARENAWHCDGTFRPVPPKGAMLRCLQTPKVGGDTVWANMAKAYEDLPETVKVQIADLKARHSFEATFGAGLSTEERHAAHQRHPDAEHPVVVVHPETGEKVLYVNAFTTHFTNYFTYERTPLGLDFIPGAAQLLTYLQLRASIPEYQVRWRWRPDSFALWDNRSTQHLAIQDYHPAVREMERATITGTEAPVAA